MENKLITFKEKITSSEEEAQYGQERETITTQETTQSTKYEVVEESHQKYYSILVRKKKVDILKNDNVFNHIQLSSLEKIFELQKRSVATSMEYISFGIISIEEIFETSSMSLVHNRRKSRMHDSYVSIIYVYKYLMEPATKMIRNSVIMDFLDRIDFEIIIAKRSKENEVIKKVATKEGSEIKKKPTKRRARLPDSSERGLQQEDDELFPSEEFRSKSPQKSNAQIIPEIKEEEVKPFEILTKKEEIKTKKDEEQVKAKEKIETKKEVDSTIKAKPKEESKPIKKKIPEKKLPVAEIKDSDLKEEEKSPKKKIPKKQLPETEDKTTEEEKRIKKKVVVKKIVKKKKVEQVSSTPFVGTGGFGGGISSGNSNIGGASYSNARHCVNEKCVVCKGLPVRPHVCTTCNKQYCNMCTYDLPNSTKCSDCKGGLIAMNQNSTTFESTITKFSSQKPEDKQSMSQISSKDFYEQNRNRYRTKLWENDESTKEPANNDNKQKGIKENNRDQEMKDNNNNLMEDDDREQRDYANNRNCDNYNNREEMDANERKRRDYEREQIDDNNNKGMDDDLERRHIDDNDKEEMNFEQRHQYTNPHKGTPTKIQPKIIRETTAKQQTAIEKNIDWGKYYYIKKYAFGLTIQKTMPLPLNDPVWSCTYVPEIAKGFDGILTGHSSGSIYLWNIDKCLKMKSFNGHTSKVFDIKFLQTKSTNHSIYFISISDDRFIKIWDISCLNPILNLGNLSSIYSLDVLSTTFIIGDKNKNLSYYQIVNQGNNNLEKEVSFTSDTDHINFIWRVLILKKIKASNYLISAGDKSLQLHQFSKENKKFIHIRDFDGHDKLIHSITEMTQGLFATTSADYTIRMWNYEESSCQKVIENYYDNAIYSLIYLNEYVEKIPKSSNIFIVGGFDKKMKLIGDVPSEDRTIEYACYDRPESLYKMIFLTNNAKFKVASINYGVSSTLFIWGANSLE